MKGDSSYEKPVINPSGKSEQYELPDESGVVSGIAQMGTEIALVFPILFYGDIHTDGTFRSGVRRDVSL